MAKTLAERLRDCAQGVRLGADGMGWSPDPALLEEAADKIVSLHAELQHARDGLTKGRTRMREDLERLREVAARMVAGIDHLDKLTREWEPDHSSGADRRGWLLAKDARDDAARLLGPNT